MKYCYAAIFCILFWRTVSYAQKIKDTVEYKQMLSNALYNYDELGDSLVDYANSFFDFAKGHSYPDAEIKGYKLLGMYHEINGIYDSALHYYGTVEQIASKTSNTEALTSVQFDKMSVYLSLQQYESAKQSLLLAMERIKQSKNVKLMGVAWSNMGIVYRRTNKKDSAYYAYTESMRIKELLKDSVGMANTRTNLASLLISDNKYSDALNLLNLNINFYKERKRFGELWYSYMSSSEAWRGLHNLLYAEKYIDSAAQLAIQYDMPQHLPTQLKGLAAIAFQKAEYKHAYQMLDSAGRIESVTINDATRKQVTELTEKFKVKQKEQHNQLLITQLQNKKLEQRNLLYALAALGSVALIILFAWMNINRKRKLLLQQNRIIELKNEQLIQLNEDKNQLISMVSHDLAQPLQQARVWVNVLQKQLSGNAENNEASLKYIEHSIEKGQQLITNVLQVEKIAAGKDKMQSEKINIHSLFTKLVKDFEPAATGKNIELLFRVDEECILHTNVQSLTQVMENLLSNAIKFSEAATSVCLSAEKNKNGNTIITIKDQGPGISETDKQIIFNKYSIGNAKPTAGEQSTGLGLNIVKRLMLEIGGSIDVESSPGKGSAFRLIFSN